MPKYVIEHDISDIDSRLPEQGAGVAQHSCNAFRELGPQIQWVQSYVITNKSYGNHRLYLCFMALIFWVMSNLPNTVHAQSSGLSDQDSRSFHQDSGDIPGAPEASDHLGDAVAAGDFNGDGHADLAIGIPEEAIGAIGNAGAVSVLYGSANGLRDDTSSRIFHQDSGDIPGEPEAFDYFGKALTAGDFNGDGHADLAIGIPEEAIGAIGNAGAVSVLYGSANGLRDDTSSRIFHQDSGDIPGEPEAFDYFGEALTAGDFNGDGHADLAIGISEEAIGAIGNAGAVSVLYGSANGLRDDTSSRIFHQDSGDIPGEPEAFDHFGKALTAGDFNGDGHADLAIGIPEEAIGAIGNAGAVSVLYGSANGLRDDTSSRIFHQDSGDIPGEPEAFDYFGEALTAGDFNGDGHADLAIGIPEEAIGAVNDAGAVSVLYGSANGLRDDTSSRIFHQDSGDIPGEPEAFDHFGKALTAGDFNGDGHADLAIGIPEEAIGAVNDAGAVSVLYGSANGLRDDTSSRIFHQDSGDIPGAPEVGDLMGDALAAGDFNGDDHSDLAIGVPLENIQTTANAGMVIVLYAEVPPNRSVFLPLVTR